MRVGFAGLGSIGEPMAGRILSAGHDLTVWNRTTAKSHLLRAAGAKVAKSPAELAEGQDLVCLCVTDALALEDVILGPDGIVQAASAPRILVDHSTVPPEQVRSLAARLRAATGAGFVDAPVSGGIAGARAGTLAVLAGGSTEDLACSRQVIESFASTITHLGPVGCGQLGKACNQIIGFLSFAAVAEAFALAVKSGIDPKSLAPAFAGGFADTPVLREWQRALADDANLLGPALHIEAIRAHLTGESGPDYTGPSPTNLAKDLRIILDLGADTGVSLPLIETLSRQFSAMRSEA